MEGRNRGTDLQNRLVNTVEEGEGGQIERVELTCIHYTFVKQLASRNLLYSTGSSAQ